MYRALSMKSLNQSSRIKDCAMSPLKPQRGSTLLVALIMLVLLTLVAISAMNSTTSSIQIVGNSQFREEARTLAQQSIEGIASYNFTALLPAASSVSYDINMDGTPDYTVTVSAPTCTSSLEIKNSDLSRTNAADVPCFSSSTTLQSGIMYSSGVPSVTGMSWCLAQKWDVQATATDVNLSGAKVVVHQGMGLRVPAGTYCP